MPRAKPAGRDLPAGLGRRPDRTSRRSRSRLFRLKAGPIDKAEPKPQTPADIINARGFWDDVPAKQATPAQVAALNARKALDSADPQPTASVSEVFNKALAYAPAAASPVDRANIVAASPRRFPRSAAVPPRIARLGRRQRDQHRRRQGHRRVRTA